MCVLRFLDFGKNMPQTLLQTHFRYFFATPFARGRPGIDSDHAFKAAMVTFREDAEDQKVTGSQKGSARIYNSRK